MISGAAGLLAGGVVALATIRKEFFNDIGKVPDIKDARKNLKEALQKEWDKFGTLDEATRGKERFSYFQKIRGMKQEGHALERTILENHGYRSKGWRGITWGSVDRTMQMSNDSKLEIAFTSLASVGIIFGAIRTFLYNRHNSQKINELTNDNTPPSQGRG